MVLSQPFNASFWSFSFGVSALEPPVCIWGVAAIMDFSIRWRAAVYLYQFYYCNTAHPYFCALMQGKLLVRTERAVLMKAEAKNDHS